MSEDKAQENEFIEEFLDAFQKQIIENKKVIADYDEKYAAKPSDAAWQALGEVRSYEVKGNRLFLRCENAFVELFWLGDASLRVRVQESNDFSQYSSFYVENLDSGINKIEVQEQDNLLLVQSGDYRYQIQRENAGLQIFKDKLLFATELGAIWQSGGGTGLSVRLQKDEAIYGTGERAFDLNLRGRKLDFWNVDPGGYERGDDPINTCISYFLGVNQVGAYGLLWDNSHKGLFDIGASNPSELKITAEAGALSYYVFIGEDVNTVMRRYTAVTGRSPLPPLWAIGYHQCRYSYMNQEEVLTVARQLREKNIPCDAIYLDIHYMDGYRIFTWNKEAFPDMKGMIDELHAMGMKLVIILDPGIKVDEGYVGHDSGIEQDVFIKYPDGKLAAGVVWPGLCYFPDFSDEKAHQWWTEQLRPLLEAGVDGLWNDMNEPLLFDNDGPPKWLPLYTKQKAGLHHELHNLYGTQMGQASREALDTFRPQKRQLSIVRAAAAGGQRWVSGWTGDSHSTWDDLTMSLITTLQMGLSGIAFTGADIGGFGHDTTAELLTRWTQAGSLLPFFRNHSAYDTVRQEPWAFSEPYESIMREAINLRYRLMPYLYTAFAQNSFMGAPIVRPLFMAEPANPNIRNIDDCYLLGDKLLVAPIMKEASIRRTVYLPEGDWYDFHTNERYQGGTLINVEAPLEKLPLFVRSGTVLPMWPVMQYQDETNLHTLSLRIYTDSGETLLYEDAGEGLDYRNGNFRWTRFRAEESTNSLSLERHTEGRFVPSYPQIELQLVGAHQSISAIEVDGKQITEWAAQGDMMAALVDANFKTVIIRA
jgi:alpha-glucosidase